MRIALAALMLSFSACTAHKLSTARASAAEQTGCQELAVFERTTGWEASGCGYSMFSATTSGPWKKMSCDEWADLGHRECVADARREAGQRSWRGTRAALVGSMIGERMDLDRCDSQRVQSVRRCRETTTAAR